MTQLRLVLFGLLAIVSVTQRFRGLLLGLTVIAVNELIVQLVRLEGPGPAARRGRRAPRWRAAVWRALAALRPAWMVRPSWWRRPSFLRRRRWSRFGAYSSYDRILGDLAWARYSRRDFDVGIRRRLLEAARVSLAEGNGIDMARDGAAARRLLGEETWALLAPDRPASEDRGAQGVELAELERAVTSIERLGPAT